MTLYEDIKPFMDAQVDDGLGDSITYRINGVPVKETPDATSDTITAFLIDLSDDGGLLEPVQPLAHRWQLKIRKAVLPQRPSMKHIVTAAKLDGNYRPMSNNPIDGGAYWIVDLQKAPA